MNTNKPGMTRMWMGLMMAFSLVLSGCASTGSSLLGDNTPGTADPRLTTGNDAKFFSTSGYQACAVAAAGGVLACTLSNSSNKAVCAVAAGLAACGVAMGANYYLDDRRAKYADTTQRLNVMSADVQKETAKVAERTSTLQRVINDDKQQIAAIERDIKAKTVDKAKAQENIASIDKNLTLMRKDVKNMQTRITEFQNVAKLERESGSNQAEVQKVEAEIAKMNNKVASLQQEVDGLYSQRSAITLG
ncbi:septal ring factor EnvC (AmiA/AmiB activator) [Pseudomonas sp. 210_17 TE3656]